VLVYLLVVLSCHRLWNREAIFHYPRLWTSRVPGLNCEACNIFWIAMVWAVLQPWVHDTIVLREVYLALAAYAPIRAAMFLYDLDFRLFHYFIKPRQQSEEPQPDKTPIPGKKCKTCGSKEDFLRDQKEAQLFKRRLIVLSGAMDWTKEDLLMNQLQALAQTGEWYIKLLVSAKTNMLLLQMALNRAGLNTNVVVRTVLDPSDAPDTEKFVGYLRQHLLITGNGLVLTHKIPENDKWTAAINEFSNTRAFALIQGHEGPVDCTKRYFLHTSATPPSLNCPEEHRVLWAKLATDLPHLLGSVWLLEITQK
jgi:hypothetical protein